MFIIVPSVGIQTNAELKHAVVVEGRLTVVLLQDLVAIKPDFVEASVVTLPRSLDDNLVPLASTDLGQLGERLDVTAAVWYSVLAADDTGHQLIAFEPKHGRRHPVIATAASTRAVGNELGQVVRLGLKFPLLRQAESKTVEKLVATLVALVVIDLRVVAASVAGCIGLRHFEGISALVGDVGDGFDGTLVLPTDVVPSVEVAWVVEFALGGGGEGTERQGGRDGVDQLHDHDATEGPSCLGKEG